MRLHILGCNGPFPAAGGATSGYLISTNQARFVMDLGEGTLARLTNITAPEELNAVFISHWHYDHACDVLPLLYRLQANANRPLTVYGPEDEHSVIRHVLMNESSIELRTVASGDKITVGDVEISVFEARHPVPAVMFRLQQGDKTLCYTGDTNTVPHFVEFAKNADLLLADGLFLEKMWDEKKPHLPAARVAELAKEACVQKLVVTHLHPAIDPHTLLQEAQRVLSQTELAGIDAVYDV